LTKKELNIQIALGTMITEPSKIAKIIKSSDDPAVIKWAARHEKMRVREAAAKHPNLSPVELIRMHITDRSVVVQRELDRVVMHRLFELLDILKFIEDYPQFNIVFKDEEITTEYHSGAISEQV